LVWVFVASTAIIGVFAGRWAVQGYRLYNILAVLAIMALITGSVTLPGMQGDTFLLPVIGAYSGLALGIILPVRAQA